MLKLTIFLFIFQLFSCNNLIKNENADVQNEVQDTSDFHNNKTDFSNNTKEIKSKEDLIGNWVGWFELNLSDEENDKFWDENEFKPEYNFWGRQNKININFQKISGDSIYGHTVVAGNDRLFKGTINEMNGEFLLKLFEPGDNKYDGKFEISIKLNDTSVNGTWESYKKLEISKRKFRLNKMHFTYDNNRMIDSNNYSEFIDWEAKMGKTKEKWSEKGDEEEVDVYLTSTSYIYKINASTQEITPKIAKELTSGDLSVIRNMIYARHGYSFKRKPLRVFFDAQDWYMPISADITKDLTELEKSNIKILMKYEKNAKAYYDYFGR